MVLHEYKRIILGLVIGGTLGFLYRKIFGCQTGACPLMATSLRAILYGASMGLLFALLGCSQKNTPSHTSQEIAMTNASHVIHLTVGGFEKIKAQDKPLLIDFWAPWCGPCRMQGPILDKVSNRVGDQAIVAKVNVDEEAPLAAPFGIQSIPTLIIMKNGKVVQRFVGVQEEDTLVKALEAASHS